MKKRPIERMLTIIIEQKSDLTRTHQYQYIKKMLEKDTKDITYAQKLIIRDHLRSLCTVCGLSYDRLLMRVCQD